MTGNCPKCDKAYEVRESGIGRQARCKCGHVFVVPPPAPRPDESGVTDTTFPDEVIAAVPVPKPGVERKVAKHEGKPTIEIVRTVVTQSQPRLLLTIAMFVVSIAFAGGWLVGRSMKIPSEAARGYKEGHAAAINEVQVAVYDLGQKTETEKNEAVKLALGLGYAQGYSECRATLTGAP
ncbi:MAG: hypothetical protein V3W34_06600 [Phycisphaerae bacterium]